MEEKLILKKINSNKKYSNQLLKQKILNEMINLGYDKNSILQILENNLKDNNNILNNEFDRVYNKLKVKYSGNELNNKTKQKLIQKGFSIHDINKLIQEKTEDYDITTQIPALYIIETIGRKSYKTKKG